MENIHLSEQETNINLSFSLEASATLWNRIFEGFESDITLVSRFEGSNIKAIKILYKFGSLVQNKHKLCKVEPKKYGIVIKTKVDEDNKIFIDNWINLMKNLKEEMTSYF
ncbi:MAG: hypothetical protein GTO02_04870 [Candidatus Dadabacteria bacterium]|nr:hypothetical protein [Candidatus Dadabacteria bacterium]